MQAENIRMLEVSEPLLHELEETDRVKAEICAAVEGIDAELVRCRWCIKCARCT
jgi:hypothetical protein